jgi:mono/diheme cytochrome c family protein
MGDGVASKGLNPKPRNFHDTAYMSTRTDAQLLEVIHNGKGAMPKWGGQLSEAEITAVLAHVRALGKL